MSNATGWWKIVTLAATLALAGCGHSAAPVAVGPLGTHVPEWSAAVPEVPETLLQPPPARRDLPQAAVSLSPAVAVGTGPAQQMEPSIAASPDGEVVVAWIDNVPPGPEEESNRWLTSVAVSLDGGLTWSRSQVRPPDARDEGPVVFEGDPMTAWDPRSGRFWVGAIAFAGGPTRGAYLASKLPGEPDLEPTAFAYPKITDKGWLAAGPQPGQPGATRLYLAHERGVQRSDDLGATWSEPVPLERDIGYLPRTGPGGEVYVSAWDGADGVVLYRSFDGGVSFEGPIRIATRTDFWPVGSNDTPQVPGVFRAPPFTCLAVDPVAGTLYALWFDTAAVTTDGADLDLFLSRSTDRGETWETPWRLHPDGMPGDQLMPWLEADEAGRLHVIYLDTREHPDDEATGALLDVWYATSGDGGRSWSETRVSDAPIDSRRASSLSGVPGLQFIGDYLGLAVAGERVHLAYPTTVNGDLDLLVRTVEPATAPPEPCVPGATTLCLTPDRYRVTVTWRDPRSGDTGGGRVVPGGTDDSGFFWFFTADNVELIVKVLDARVVNGHVWVFIGQLTNVEYTVTVTDTATNETKTYFNPAGRTAGFMDVTAF